MSRFKNKSIWKDIDQTLASIESIKDDMQFVENELIKSSLPKRKQLDKRSTLKNTGPSSYNNNKSSKHHKQNEHSKVRFENASFKVTSKSPEETSLKEPDNSTAFKMSDLNYLDTFSVPKGCCVKIIRGKIINDLPNDEEEEEIDKVPSVLFKKYSSVPIETFGYSTKGQVLRNVMQNWFSNQLSENNSQNVVKVESQSSLNAESHSSFKSTLRKAEKKKVDEDSVRLKRKIIKCCSLLDSPTGRNDRKEHYENRFYLPTTTTTICSSNFKLDERLISDPIDEISNEINSKNLTIKKHSVIRRKQTLCDSLPTQYYGFNEKGHIHFEKNSANYSAKAIKINQPREVKHITSTDKITTSSWRQFKKEQKRTANENKNNEETTKPIKHELPESEIIIEEETQNSRRRSLISWRKAPKLKTEAKQEKELKAVKDRNYDRKSVKEFIEVKKRERKRKENENKLETINLQRKKEQCLKTLTEIQKQRRANKTTANSLHSPIKKLKKHSPNILLKRIHVLQRHKNQDDQKYPSFTITLSNVLKTCVTSQKSVQTEIKRRHFKSSTPPILESQTNLNAIKLSPEIGPSSTTCLSQIEIPKLYEVGPVVIENRESNPFQNGHTLDATSSNESSSTLESSHDQSSPAINLKNEFPKSVFDSINSSQSKSVPPSVPDSSLHSSYSSTPPPPGAGSFNDQHFPKRVIKVDNSLNGLSSKLQLNRTNLIFQPDGPLPDSLSFMNVLKRKIDLRLANHQDDIQQESTKFRLPDDLIGPLLTPLSNQIENASETNREIQISDPTSSSLDVNKTDPPSSHPHPISPLPLFDDNSGHSSLIEEFLKNNVYSKDSSKNVCAEEEEENISSSSLKSDSKMRNGSSSSLKSLNIDRHFEDFQESSSSSQLSLLDEFNLNKDEKPLGRNREKIISEEVPLLVESSVSDSSRLLQEFRSGVNCLESLHILNETQALKMATLNQEKYAQLFRSFSPQQAPQLNKSMTTINSNPTDNSIQNLACFEALEEIKARHQIALTKVVLEAKETLLAQSRLMLLSPPSSLAPFFVHNSSQTSFPASKQTLAYKSNDTSSERVPSAGADVLQINSTDFESFDEERNYSSNFDDSSSEKNRKSINESSHESKSSSLHRSDQPLQKDVVISSSFSLDNQDVSNELDPSNDVDDDDDEDVVVESLSGLSVSEMSSISSINANRLKFITSSDKKEDIESLSSQNSSTLKSFSIQEENSINGEEDEEQETLTNNEELNSRNSGTSLIASELEEEEDGKEASLRTSSSAAESRLEEEEEESRRTSRSESRSNLSIISKGSSSSISGSSTLNEDETKLELKNEPSSKSHHHHHHRRKTKMKLLSPLVPLRKSAYKSSSTLSSLNGEQQGGRGDGDDDDDESNNNTYTSVSGNVSEQSDIEGRILALREQLKERKNEASKLAKEMNRRYRESLKQKEISLQKQIKAYENYIEKTKQELDQELLNSTNSSSELISNPVKNIKPKIRSSAYSRKKNLLENDSRSSASVYSNSSWQAPFASRSNLYSTVGELCKGEEQSSVEDSTEKGDEEIDDVSQIILQVKSIEKTNVDENSQTILKVKNGSEQLNKLERNEKSLEDGSVSSERGLNYLTSLETIDNVNSHSIEHPSSSILTEKSIKNESDSIEEENAKITDSYSSINESVTLYSSQSKNSVSKANENVISNESIETNVSDENEEIQSEERVSDKLILEENANVPLWEKKSNVVDEEEEAFEIEVSDDNQSKIEEEFDENDLEISHQKEEIISLEDQTIDDEAGISSQHQVQISDQYKEGISDESKKEAFSDDYKEEISDEIKDTSSNEYKEDFSNGNEDLSDDDKADLSDENKADLSDENKADFSDENKADFSDEAEISDEIREKLSDDVKVEISIENQTSSNESINIVYDYFEIDAKASGDASSPQKTNQSNTSLEEVEEEKEERTLTEKSENEFQISDKELLIRSPATDHNNKIENAMIKLIKEQIGFCLNLAVHRFEKLKKSILEVPQVEDNISQRVKDEDERSEISFEKESELSKIVVPPATPQLTFKAAQAKAITNMVVQDLIEDTIVCFEELKNQQFLSRTTFNKEDEEEGEELLLNQAGPGSPSLHISQRVSDILSCLNDRNSKTPPSKFRPQDLMILSPMFDDQDWMEKEKDSIIPEDYSSVVDSSIDIQMEAEWFEDDIGLVGSSKEASNFSPSESQEEKQVSYYYRQIPDKPPPPYTPPQGAMLEKLAKLGKSTTPAAPPPWSIPNSEAEVKQLLISSSKQLFQGFSSGYAFEEIQPDTEYLETEARFDEITAKNERAYRLMIFDICKEAAKEILELVTTDLGQEPWKRRSKIGGVKSEMLFPSNETDFIELIGKLARSKLGQVVPKGLATKYKHKKHDFVDALLLQDLGKEEIDWVNYEEDEVQVKLFVTESIFAQILDETVAILKEKEIGAVVDK